MTSNPALFILFDYICLVCSVNKVKLTAKQENAFYNWAIQAQQFNEFKSELWGRTESS